MAFFASPSLLLINRVFRDDSVGRMKPKGLLIGAAVLVPAVLLGLVFRSFCSSARLTAGSADCGPAVSVVIKGRTKVDGYSAEQLKNAAAIMNAGQGPEPVVKGQMVSVMVALGESGSRVLDHR